ncbi:MAG: DUF992 domain-containing protein [Hyphomicrobium sp.]|nr:DUF992 domain-containing protein [Hyphomicrobium sp.]
MATTTLAAIGSAPSSAQNAAQPGQRATRSAQEGSGQNAQTARIVTGTLTCRGSGTVGLVLGSKQTLSCVFERTSGGAGANYTARITRIGLDIGVTGRNVMVWTVLASSDNLPNSALAGRYKGISANASVGVGVGANALIGGNRNSIVLQPLSVQAQTGVNIAAGVTGLRLTQN